MKLLSWLFWRILLPFVLALGLTFIAIVEIGGGAGSFHGIGRSSLIHGHGWEGRFFIYVFAVFLIVTFANELRMTLKWGKEAEEFESELKEADAIEEERCQRTS